MANTMKNIPIVFGRGNPGGIYVLGNLSGTGDVEIDIHAEGVWK